MPTTDFLDEKRREIAERLAELRPLVDEYARLQAAADALAGVSAPAPAIHAATAQRSPTRSPARKRARGKRGRPKGSGTRGVEALALVKANPGITIPQIAEQMGIKQNYLYRVLPRLAQEGRVVKDGRGWKPKDPA